MSSDSHANSHYRIGAVARLSGVAVETLRVWERRYGAVKPLRTEGGSRLYSELDVARLVLIKRLVDAGHAIGTVANLSSEQLEDRSATSRSARMEQDQNRPATIAIIGSTLPTRLRAALGDALQQSLRVGDTFADLADFQKVAEGSSFDGLVIEVPVVIEDTVDQLRHLQRYSPPGRIVIVYGYGKRASIGDLESLGVVALQHPTSWSEIQRVFEVNARPSRSTQDNPDEVDILTTPIPPRIFSDRQLATIASASTGVYCECPNHLVDLVVSLKHFELYSADCENRSSDDAALHAYLHRATARARALLESALHRLVEVDGIQFDEDPARDPSATQQIDIA